MMEKYIKTYEINSSQCDRDGKLRLRTLFNFFQDLADFHADKMGLGYHFCTKRGLGWIGGAYDVQINRMPVWEDEIALCTWPSDRTAVTGIREFQMQDGNGQVLVNATSQWVLVDTVKMRPVAVAKHIGSYELIPERTIETSFPSLPEVARVDTTVVMPVRVDDIDINNHVNNAVYPTIALDGLSQAFLDTHTLVGVQVVFKKPAKLGDTFCIKTQTEELSTFHQLFNQDESIEFARVKLDFNIKELAI